MRLANRWAVDRGTVVHIDHFISPLTPPSQPNRVALAMRTCRRPRGYRANCPCDGRRFVPRHDLFNGELLHQVTELPRVVPALDARLRIVTLSQQYADAASAASLPRRGYFALFAGFAARRPSLVSRDAPPERAAHCDAGSGFRRFWCRKMPPIVKPRHHVNQIPRARIVA